MGPQYPPARPRNHRAGLGHATGDDEPKFHDQAGSVVGGAVQLGECMRGPMNSRYWL
ncbi:hypothetical protein PXNS11_70023 [Stutzerimonas xanthomarina]|nr:hypothetical protein PXNS11_70023 [Stutzerimonas xanthomarina]